MEYELNAIIGDSPTWNITFKDSDGVAIDITGYTFYMTIKDNLCDTDDDAIASVDVLPAQISDPTNGIVSIAMSSSVTKLISEGTYYYDIKYKKTDETVMTALFGKINFKLTATRRAS